MIFFVNKQRYCVLALTLFGLLSGGYLSAKEHAQEVSSVPWVKVSKDFDETIAKELKYYLDDLNQDGIGVVIRVDQGVASWRGAAGYGQLDECCQQTRSFSSQFRVGSITKLFVASIVLSLVEAEQLKLDDTLGQLFPEEQQEGGWLHNNSWAKAITIRELIGMRTVIGDYTSAPDINFSDNCTPLRVYTPQELVSIGFKIGEEQNVEAQKKCNYSNTNYIILGLLIEKITQKPLAANLSENIFAPLNLHHIMFPKNASMPEDHVSGYGTLVNIEQSPYSLCYLPRDPSLPNNEGNEIMANVTYRTTSIPWAAGAIVSDMDDLIEAVKAQVKGTVPKLSKTLLNKRVNDLVPMEEMAHKLQEEGVLKEDESLNYGLGIMTFKQYAGHAGAILGYYSMALYNKDDDIAIGVNFNQYPSGTQKGDALIVAIHLTRIMEGATGLTYGVAEQAKPVDEPLAIEE